MNMELLEVENNDPNGTLVTWLTHNKDNYKIRAITLCETDNDKLYWHIYHVS